jgi:hypothetical protein
MRFISLKVHGILDYVTVAAFLAVPSIFGLSGTPAYVAYGLAGVHFLMTALTDFPLGLLKVLPLKFHQIVETLVGPVIIASPWVLSFSDDATSRNIYIVAGILIGFVGLVTDYSKGQTAPVQ